MKSFNTSEEHFARILKDIAVNEKPNRARFDIFLRSLLEKPALASIPYRRESRFLSLIMRSPYFSISVGALAIIFILSAGGKYVPAVATPGASTIVVAKTSFSFLSEEEIKNTNGYISKADTESQKDLATFGTGPDTSALTIEHAI